MNGPAWTGEELEILRTGLLVARRPVPEIRRTMQAACPPGRTLWAIYSKMKELGWQSGGGHVSEQQRRKILARVTQGNRTHNVLLLPRARFAGTPGQVPRGCPYIIGQLHEPDWHYCQAQPVAGGEPYCLEHFILCHDLEKTRATGRLSREREAWWAHHAKPATVKLEASHGR